MTDRVNDILQHNILPLLAPDIRLIIKKIDKSKLNNLTEIRLRANKPLVLEKSRGELIIDQYGKVRENLRQAYLVTKSNITDTLQLMTNSSLYTLDEELKAGYLTLTGGHRVGLVGQVISKNNQIERIKHIAGLNIRICQEIIGAADGVIDQIIAGRKEIYNTLIISPPRCGKTTLIRDLTRQISDGVSSLKFDGLKVGVVDERSEIGGSYQGVPQNKLGIRTDLLDRCPKVEGMMLLIRSMSPDVIVTDELGSKADVEALEEVINAGVKIITTIHGNNLQEVKSRPTFTKIIKSNIFKRIIVLSYRQGPGTIERIIKK